MKASFTGRRDLAIINRSFWPIYPVIGEALLRYAEGLSDSLKVSVIMQDHVGIEEQLSKYERGKGVEFFPCKAWSNSSSGLIVRALDALFFMFWVFASLLWSRPRRVYVSTDPPVLVPFVVMVYARLFRASYIYHLQDIHPEAANVVVRMHSVVFSFLRWLDGIVMRRADALITITEEMALEIRKRSRTASPIHIVSNPAVSFDGVVRPAHKISGFSFCGNAGRLQRIPLLLEAIDRYLESGGTMRFGFAGGGVHAEEIRALAKRHDKVSYFGLVSATEAAQINCDFEWALLPIEDKVTQYAFPSKSSSYVFAGASVLAVCGEDTSVAQWVKSNRLGVVVPPDLGALVQCFRDIESKQVCIDEYALDRSALMENLSFERFIERLREIVLPGKTDV